MGCVMNKIGRVSVIIVWKQCVEELLETVNSIVEQNYINWEIIIADVTNEHNSVEKVSAQLVNYDNIIYLKADAKLLVNEALNWAISNATGEYIAFAECGTLWSRDKLEKQIQALTLCKVCGWHYGICEVDEKYYVPPKFWPEYKKKQRMFPELIMDICINLNSVLVRRSCLDDIGLFDDALSELYEYEFLLRLALAYPCAYEDKVLVKTKSRGMNAENILMTQCYILGEFAKPLENLGLKEEKFNKVVEFAENYRLMAIFGECAKILMEDSAYKMYIENYYQKKNPKREIKTSSKTDISGVRNCVGCAGCMSICPVRAISMGYDKYGFLFPVIQEDKCIHCGKCLTVCPTQKELELRVVPDVCYATQASMEERQKSTSGAVFPLLANAVLEVGGYVSGAVYDKDFRVQHIVSNKTCDMERMRSSKYVQSNTIGVYEQIGTLLDQGETVLFSGCPCQVAGLKAFLEKEYEKLYTVDVVCHGVPSPMVYESYLKEFTEKYGKILEVDFRKKKEFGWKTGLYIRFEDGKEYSNKGYEPYLFSFLNDWILRDCCYQCEYKGRGYADITLGDFWGVAQLDETMDDGTGTSYVAINSVKGVELFANIKDKLRTLKIFKNQDAIKYNPSIARPANKTKFREILFENIHTDTLQNAMGRSFAQIHFDIGLALWWSSNYGNAMTNYALYQVLSRKWSVLAIDNVVMRPSGRFRRFAKENYQLSSDYFLGGMQEIIKESCNAFVVGSDQTWNIHFEKMFHCGKFFQLDFVDDTVKKISYASSFGMEGAEPPAEEYAEDYRKFDCISVREQFGVKLCREKYDVEAEWVLDPVFLLEEKDYDVLVENAKVREEEPFIMAYLLNPTTEKREVCKKIRDMLGGIKIINVSENSSQKRDEYRHVLEFDNVMGDIEVEDWIYYMKNCRYVITDSFHGTCFAVIFKKQYLTFINRQPGRFQVFDKFTGTCDRICQHVDLEDMERYLKDIDYEVIHEELAKERERCLKWLDNALES